MKMGVGNLAHGLASNEVRLAPSEGRKTGTVETKKNADVGAFFVG